MVRQNGRFGKTGCKQLKEGSGKGRFVVTGVRWDESARRKISRAGLELHRSVNKRICEDPDNPANAEMARYCPTAGEHVLNPIIDWTTEDVWEFIRKYELLYCELYDKGHKRLGCIGCPMSTNQKKELEKNPKYKQAYLRAFGRMIQKLNDEDSSSERSWKTPEDVMRWWLER